MPQETILPPDALPTAEVKQPTAEDLAGFSFPDQTSVSIPGTEVVPTPDNKPTEQVAPTEPQAPVTAPVTPPEPAAPETKVSLPARFDGESEVQYNIRLEIFQAGQAKAAATTEEEKSVLTQQIKGLRKSLAETSKEVAVPVTTQKAPETVPEQTLVQPSEEEIAKAQLRKLGFITEDQMEAELQKRLDARSTVESTERRVVEHANAANEFYSTRPDIANNPQVKEQFEQFVVTKYLSKMDATQLSKSEFSALLEMSANYAFPKPNVSKAADTAQDKVDLVNFTGGTQPAIVSDKGPAKSVRETLKSQGWSDSDIAKFQL